MDDITIDNYVEMALRLNDLTRATMNLHELVLAYQGVIVDTLSEDGFIREQAHQALYLLAKRIISDRRDVLLGSNLEEDTEFGGVAE